jgi:hypothetical protein
VWGQAFSAGQNTSRNESYSAQKQSQDLSETTGFQLMKVFYDKNEWRNRNETLRLGFTSDMNSLLTIEGYDMIESS